MPRPTTSRSSAPSPLQAPATTAPTVPLRIAVLGMGLVGQVVAVQLAGWGHHVTAADADTAAIGAMQADSFVTPEPGLAALLQAERKGGRLGITSDCAAALAGADLIVITVDTPPGPDGAIVLDALDRLTGAMRRTLPADAVIALMSTVPVGTARKLQAALNHGTDAAATAQVLSCPHFLREGSALDDFMRPDRLIVGGGSDTARARLLQVFAPLTARGVPVLTMDANSAELAKAAANAMLATRISFINELAAIAAATGADIEQVCEGMGSDRRIGRTGLQAGLGYGGASLPRDLGALRSTAREYSLRSDMLQATERVNARQRSWAFDALQRDLGSTAAMRGLRVAIWGLAAKPGSADMHEAPSLALIERLVRAGVSVQLYDPLAMPNARAVLPVDRRIAWVQSASAALERADALMLVTEWPEFFETDPSAIAAALRLRTVYDGRNAVDLKSWSEAGLRVVQVGRPEAGRLPMPKREMIVDAASVPAQPTVSPFAALSAAFRSADLGGAG